MPSKEKIKKVKKPKQKQKQKQKQSIVININSNNKKAASSATKGTAKGSGQPNIPNTPTPQYITRGMPPTINNQPSGPPGAAPDMTRILSGMAEMSANFSGIGSLTNVIKGMNDRQSALETRLSEQYGLQNDFNNDQAHFNNQARNFFTNTQTAPPPLPHNYYFGGFRSRDPETDSEVSDLGYAQYNNASNPFRFEPRPPVQPLEQLQLGDSINFQSNLKNNSLPEGNNTDTTDNAYSMIPQTLQPDYSIPRYIPRAALPAENVYNEPLQLTNDPDEEVNDVAAAAALPIANSEAENIVEQFIPQPNLLEPANDGVVQTRINDLESIKNEREARKQQKLDELQAKTKTKDGRVATQDDGDVLQPSLARDAHNQKMEDLKKQDEIRNNAVISYANDYDNILKDYDWFMESMDEQKFNKNGSVQKTMNGEELIIYNKLMKVGTDETYKNSSTATHRTTALKNIIAREKAINEFVKREQPKQKQPEQTQKEYVPLDERMMTMADLTDSGGVAAPPSSANDIKFG